MATNVHANAVCKLPLVHHDPKYDVKLLRPEHDVKLLRPEHDVTSASGASVLVRSVVPCSTELVQFISEV